MDGFTLKPISSYGSGYLFPISKLSYLLELYNRFDVQ